MFQSTQCDGHTQRATGRDFTPPNILDRRATAGRSRFHDFDRSRALIGDDEIVGQLFILPDGSKLVNRGVCCDAPRHLARALEHRQPDPDGQNEAAGQEQPARFPIGSGCGRIHQEENRCQHDVEEKGYMRDRFEAFQGNRSSIPRK